MARIRRPKKITGGEYTFGGGGGGASGDVVRFMRYSDNAVENGGAGVLHDAGTEAVFKPIKVTLEAGLSVDSTAQTNSRVYWDHAFEAPSNVTAVLVTEADELPSGVGSTVPTGLSVNVNSDNTDNDTGNIYFSGTVNSAVEAGTYKWRYRVSQQGWTVNYIDYEVEVWPQGTTPVFSSTVFTESRIIRNQADKQYITPTVTATEAVGFYIIANTGFPAGVTPKIETDGRVYVENVGDIEQAAQAHTVTIRVDLGQYGLVDQEITGSISYGDPYGSRYFGPVNAYRDYSGGDYRSNSDPTRADGSYWHNFKINQGALNFITNAGRSSTPYTSSYNGVVSYSDSGGVGTSATGTTAVMRTNYQGNFWTSGNGYQQIYRWTVPNGVTQFSVVAIGAGAPGSYNWSNHGGGGGGLAYCNAVTCTPGETFTVAVGVSRYRVSSQSQYHSGDSFLLRDSNNEYIVIGYGGGHYSGRSAPHGWIGSSRSNSNSTPSNPTSLTLSSNPQFNNQKDPGSAAASTAYGTRGAYYGGWSTSYGHGGGAAGYRGTGLGGGDQSRSSSGGGNNGRDYSSTYGGSGGGGVGADGNGRGVSDFGYSYGSAENNSNTNSYSSIGSHGYRYGGGGGSGGTRGDWGENPYTGRGHFENTNYGASGGLHGGGGGGSGSNGSPGGGRGGPGCVRIIWGAVNGTQRAFPNTYTTERIEINGQS